MGALVDWYAVLGVRPEATEAELRAAWRAVARALHPDTTPGEAAADRFQLAREAWGLLGDASRRATHDAACRAYADAVAPLPAGLVERLVGVRAPEAASGQDLRCQLDIPAALAVTGGERALTLPGRRACGDCGETGLAPRGRPLVCGRCGGRGFIVTRPVLRATSEPCPACDAAGWVPERACEGCGGRGELEAERRVIVPIPPGVATGVTLRVAGAGLRGPGRGPPGDLLVAIRVAPGPWEVRGTDWTGPLEVPFWLALTGGALDAETPWGTRRIAIPASTAEGTLLRLSGLGVGRRGDGYLRVAYGWPAALSREQAEALRVWGEAVWTAQGRVAATATVEDS